jgi:hypothetical protein
LVSGIRREDNEPDPPETGKVWQAILGQVDVAGSKSEFVSVSDPMRESFHRHPWNIGGGGVAELKDALDDNASSSLAAYVQSIGFGAILGEDELFGDFPNGQRVRRLPKDMRRLLVEGDQVRDWVSESRTELLFPYTDDIQLVPEHHISRWLWMHRTTAWSRPDFSRKTYRDCGRTYWEYHQIPAERNRTLLSIVFAFVATHNHFVLERGGKVFNRSAPVIKLLPGASEDDHLTLSGLLNSSVAAFWMRQVFFCKGGGGNGRGISAEAWERMLEYDGTKMRHFPVPWATSTDSSSSCQRTVLNLARRLDACAQARTQALPGAVCHRMSLPTQATLETARAQAVDRFEQMISLQEELDWLAYRVYGLLDDSLAEHSSPPPIKRGQRAFEIVMARQMANKSLQTEWFPRHRATLTLETPPEWPEDYRRVVEQRINLIETNPSIRLIEKPEYKRRWNLEPWDEQLERALRGWLLDRLEGYFDLDGRMNDGKQVTAHGDLRTPRLTSVMKVADMARQDKDFMQVAELYAGRMDFDVANLVGELVTAESVPALPILRYKPSGLDKRTAWERTWDLQRLEDAVDGLFEEQRKKIEERRVGDPRSSVFALPASFFDLTSSSCEVLRRELEQAADYLAEAARQNADLTSEAILKPVTDAAKRAKKAVVGDIPVPPKYVSADFVSSDYWRLRGKLDVPKERWVSFPHCEGEDGTLVIAWAGYDHLQMARAIAERYELAKEQEGRKLVPLLAAIGQLIPWLKQWHNELDPAFGTRMGDYFEGYLAEEAKALGMSVNEVMAWTPPEKGMKSGRRKKIGRQNGCDPSPKDGKGDAGLVARRNSGEK